MELYAAFCAMNSSMYELLPHLRSRKPEANVSHIPSQPGHHNYIAFCRRNNNDSARESFFSINSVETWREHCVFIVKVKSSDCGSINTVEISLIVLNIYM